MEEVVEYVETNFLGKILTFISYSSISGPLRLQVVDMYDRDISRQKNTRCPALIKYS